MSQGTALQALVDGYRTVGNASYLATGNRALAVFTAAPPAGVAVTTSLGARYVQYTFAPGRGDEVINGFLQSLIGLDAYARTSKDPLAARLFAAGNAEAQAELPQFDTGAWSLYQPGLEEDLSYHELVTGLLQQLCSVTKVSVYCGTAARFGQYLKTPAHATTFDHAPRGRARIERLLHGLEDRTCRHHRPAWSEDAVPHQRQLPVRPPRIRDSCPPRRRQLHRAPGRNRPRRQLQPDPGERAGESLIVGHVASSGHPSPVPSAARS
jgi:D-glucuronyl C5-epimerase-like protein